jgi:hypothetical protein
MFLFNVYLDKYGVGRPPKPPLSENEQKAAKLRAHQHAEDVVLYVQDTAAAPRDTYTALEMATMEWVERLITCPHSAHTVEQRLRSELDAENKREIAAGVRRLDVSPDIGPEAAHRRLIDHQIAELAMLTGHMDGLGRVMIILRLESEGEVKTDDKYLTSRPALFQVYDSIGVTEKARSANELRLNPALLDQLKEGKKKSPVSAEDAAKTGEF